MCVLDLYCDRRPSQAFCCWQPPGRPFRQPWGVTGSSCVTFLWKLLSTSLASPMGEGFLAGSIDRLSLTCCFLHLCNLFEAWPPWAAYYSSPLPGCMSQAFCPRGLNSSYWTQADLARLTGACLWLFLLYCLSAFFGLHAPASLSCSLHLSANLCLLSGNTFYPLSGRAGDRQAVVTD